MELREPLLEETILSCACANDDSRTVDVCKLANYRKARITLKFAGPEWVRQEDDIRTHGRGDLTCGSDFCRRPFDRSGLLNV
jgi:hypothetical protein